MSCAVDFTIEEVAKRPRDFTIACAEIAVRIPMLLEDGTTVMLLEDGLTEMVLEGAP